MIIDYSAQRKAAQSIGSCPDWYTTGGYQMFMEKYSWKGETVRSRFRSVAIAMAKHAPKVYPAWWEEDEYTRGKDWEDVFFDAMWDAHVSPSTPLLANGGLRQRGTTVSCAGGNVRNYLFDRYNHITEAAILTKHSHGTSYSLDDWPAYGDQLARGGRSLGVMPIIRDEINVMEEVTQGARRGSLAYSIRPQHGDFNKVVNYLYERTESNNVGWLIDDDFIKRMATDDDIAAKFGKMLGVKLPRGKGYFTFIDKMNRHLALAFKRLGLRVNASNLCQETCLPSNEEYTFSCVILNYNLETYRPGCRIRNFFLGCKSIEYLLLDSCLNPVYQNDSVYPLTFTRTARSKHINTA